MSYVDIGMLAIIAIMMIVGLIKGFARNLVSLFGFLVSALAAILLAKVVAEALLSVATIGKWVAGSDKSLFTFIRGLLPDGLDKVSTAQLQAAGSTEAAAELFKNSGFFESFFVKLCFPLVKDATQNAVYLNSAMQTARELFALEIAYTIFVFICGILLFIAIRLVVACINIIFKKIISRAGKNPGAGSRLGGMILGAVRGVLYSIVILGVLTLMTNFSFMSTVNKEMDKSVIAKPVMSVSFSLCNSVLKSKQPERYRMLIEYAGFIPATAN